MDTEQGNSSAVSVALNCPGQSCRVGWVLLLRWNLLLWSLLPFSCWVGEDPVWLRLPCSSSPFQKEELAVCLGALVPSECFHALQLHPCFAQLHVVPKDKGQDVAGWDHLMGDLSSGWCQRKGSARAQVPVFGSEGPLCLDPRQGEVVPQKVCLGPLQSSG